MSTKHKKADPIGTTPGGNEIPAGTIIQTVPIEIALNDGIKDILGHNPGRRLVIYKTDTPAPEGGFANKTFAAYLTHNAVPDNTRTYPREGETPIDAVLVLHEHVGFPSEPPAVVGRNDLKTEGDRMAATNPDRDPGLIPDSDINRDEGNPAPVADTPPVDPESGK